jgi:hypothetical protein
MAGDQGTKGGTRQRRGQGSPSQRPAPTQSSTRAVSFYHFLRPGGHAKFSGKPLLRQVILRHSVRRSGALLARRTASTVARSAPKAAANVNISVRNNRLLRHVQPLASAGMRLLRAFAQSSALAGEATPWPRDVQTDASYARVAGRGLPGHLENFWPSTGQWSVANGLALPNWLSPSHGPWHRRHIVSRRRLPMTSSLV